MFDLEIAVLDDDFAKRTTRKRSKQAVGRKAPKSAAHRKAISAGMRRYWASKRAASRRKGTTKRASTQRATKPKTKSKSTRKSSGLKTKAQREAWKRADKMIFRTKKQLADYKRKHKIPQDYNGR